MVYTISEDTVIEGTLQTTGAIYNNSNYNILDNNGSTWISSMRIENSSPDTDFHFVPNFTTQSEGHSRVFFGYGSNFDSYNWMFGQGEALTTLMSLDSTGLLYLSSGPIMFPGGTSSVPGLWFGTAAPSNASWGGNLGIGLNNSTQIVLNANGVKTSCNGTIKNTLDDGSGNMTLAGLLSANTGIVTQRGEKIACVAPYVTIANRVLPTQAETYKTYTDLGHGNLLFEHAASEDAQHHFPPSGMGKYANIYLIMLQDTNPQHQTDYQPMIAMDRGLWVEKDIQAYGALMTSTDPGKTTGGGAVFIGHGLNEPNDPPSIIVPDTNYNTLHIYSNIYSHTLGNLRASFMQADLLSSNGNLSIGHLEADGTIPLYLDVYGVVSYQSSTIRGKENVKELPDCSWLYDLRPVSFTWKDSKRANLEGTRIGLIAEEVNAVCPQLTWLDKEGKPEGVHYEWLGIPLLVEVKKLHNQVESLQAQVYALIQKVAA